MIDKSLIQKLHAAGVSPDVILQLVLDDDTPAAQAEPAAKDPAPAAHAEPAAQDPAHVAIPQGDAILQAINRLTGSIQAMNIRGIGGSTPPAQPTSHDALAYMLSSGAPEKGA